MQSVDGQNRERDYCILTIFLICGLRISELCGLDLQDIQDDALRVKAKAKTFTQVNIKKNYKKNINSNNDVNRNKE